MFAKSIPVMASVLLLVPFMAQASGPAEGAPVAKFDAAVSVPPQPDPSVQKAEPADMRIMASYIGTFRGSDQVFDDGATKFHFTVEYAWFDAQKTIVKYTVSMVVPSQDRVLTTSEGFYGYDPFSKTIYVFGAFRFGMTGWGSMGSFDHETKAREIWATSMRPDGAVMHVRDHFELLDADSWRNTTHAQENDGEWKVVHQDTYTRVKE